MFIEFIKFSWPRSIYNLNSTFQLKTIVDDALLLFAMTNTIVSDDPLLFNVSQSTVTFYDYPQPLSSPTNQSLCSIHISPKMWGAPTCGGGGVGGGGLPYIRQRTGFHVSTWRATSETAVVLVNKNQDIATAL
jgi:hypothetical protein